MNQKQIDELEINLIETIKDLTQVINRLVKITKKLNKQTPSKK